MLWDRERYIAHVLFKNTGREMFCELFGPLHRLESEWRQQGATEQEINMTAFDWDYVPTCYLAGNTGAVTGIAPQILHEDDTVQLAIDHMGRHTRWIKASATIGLPEDFPIREYADWEKLKPWYQFRESRVDKEKLLLQKKARENGALTVLSIPGAFDEPRGLMGEALLCYACYEAPEMLHDLLDTVTQMTVAVIERVGSVVPIDDVFVHEDMAGKNGPLIGPAQVREFFYPYYSRVWAAAKACGAKIFSLDSDGDISPVLDELVACGINSIHPCEPVGGMDLVSLHRRYGSRLSLKGGIDKFALLHGKQAIRDELERKLVPELFGGGTVFALDHRIPNGVPLEDYRYYVNLGREMLHLPPIAGSGWGRMAF